MSSQRQKIKHSQRLQRKHATIKKQIKIAKSHRMPVTDKHRFVKQHAMNCGRPNCMLCANPRRTWKERTIQEKSFDQTEKWM